MELWLFTAVFYSSPPMCNGCGIIDIYISAEHGVITELRFCGDYFSISDPHELAAKFVGYAPEEEAYESILYGVDVP